MTSYFEQIINKFNNKLQALKQTNPISIMCAFGYQEFLIQQTKLTIARPEQQNQALINYNEFINYVKKTAADKLNLDVNNTEVLIAQIRKLAQPVFELQKQLQLELQQAAITNNHTLSHTTLMAPSDFEGGTIIPSKNRENMYLTQVGNFLFATSSTDQENRYAARCGNNGMISMNDIVILPTANNLYMDRGELRLIKPAYTYYLNPEQFMPQVKISNSQNGPLFTFGEEWISTKPVNIHNPSQVLGINQIDNITPLLNHCQLLACKTTHFPISKVNVQNAQQMALEGLKNGQLISFNNELNLNFNLTQTNKKAPV